MRVRFGLFEKLTMLYTCVYAGFGSNQFMTGELHEGEI